LPEVFFGSSLVVVKRFDCSDDEEKGRVNVGTASEGVSWMLFLSF
jgi:hypothetical protein